MKIERNKNPSIRKVRFLPEDLELTPPSLAELTINENVGISLCSLFGFTEDGSRRVDATLWNALKVSTYGSAFTEYDSITGSAPAAYSDTHEISNSPGFHRIDVNALSAPLLLRFKNYRTGDWGEDIYVPAGFMSLELDAQSVQVKLQSGTASNYYITIYW